MGTCIKLAWWVCAQAEGLALQGTAVGRKRQRTEERQGDVHSGTAAAPSGAGLQAPEAQPAKLQALKLAEGLRSEAALGKEDFGSHVGAGNGAGGSTTGANTGAHCTPPAS